MSLHAIAWSMIHSQAAASIWFEIWGVVDPRQQKFRFFKANFREISIFQAILKKIRFFQGKFLKYFDSSRQIFKKFRFFSGKCLKTFDPFRQF